MKAFFAWRPLMPSRADTHRTWRLANWADSGAGIFLGFGILQVLLGLDTGLFRLVPMALGVLLFGLPHGAIDHLVALGLANQPLRPTPLSCVLTAYLAVVGAVLALWMILPAAAALGFLVMTIYHWGKSDVAFERFVSGSAFTFRGVWADRIHAILRGLIPIGLPFLVFPDQATEFLNACIQFFAPDYQIAWTLWRALVFAAFGIFFLADLWVHLLNFRDPLARRIVIENVALTLFFCIVPPLIAIGWYFAGWHGFRHILRLCTYKGTDVSFSQSIRKNFIRVGWQAVPFTVAAIVMLAALSLWMLNRISSPFEWVALYLVLISALTLPHLMVVEWMDRREDALSAGKL